MGQCSTLPAEATAARAAASSSTNNTASATATAVGLRFDGVFQHSNMNIKNGSNTDCNNTEEPRHRLRDHGDGMRKGESLDFNALVGTALGPQNLKDNIALNSNNNKSGQQQTPFRDNHNYNNVMQQPPQSREPETYHGNHVYHSHCQPYSQQYPDDHTCTGVGDEAEPMEVEKLDQLSSTIRDNPPLKILQFPPPPEVSVRTRCYKLNLNSKALSLSSSQKQNMWFGPFTPDAPQLTHTCSSDEEVEGLDLNQESSLPANSSNGGKGCERDRNSSPTTVAIMTAQIFRGITVARDGTILSQNARATRSNRGNKQKKGEKSRQAAKIDKAKDLVEESIATGKAPDSDEPANMVSLVIVGEYDDMKHLVRDGSKKLRDAGDLPDDALATFNKPRTNIIKPNASRAMSCVPLSSINAMRRISPTFVNSQRVAAQMSPGKVVIQIQGTNAATQGLNSQQQGPVMKQNSSLSYQQQQQQQYHRTQQTSGNSHQNLITTHNAPPSPTPTSPSPPPKLKVHPRDTRPGRREDRTGLRMRLDSACQHGYPRGDDNGASGVGVGGVADWSHAWNIWNCGGAGTVSPLQPSSPKDNNTNIGGGNNNHTNVGGGNLSQSKVVYEGRDSSHTREAGVTNRTS